MKTLIFLCLLLAGTSAFGQSLADLDAKNGFRDLEFGQSIKSVKGLVPLTKVAGNDVKYKRPTDVLKIDGEPLKSITYCFYRGVLSTVSVEYSSARARAKLLQSLQLSYGFGVDSTLTQSSEGTIWLGKKTVMALGDNSPGELFIKSLLVEQVKKQDSEAEYKKRVGGL